MEFGSKDAKRDGLLQSGLSQPAVQRDGGLAGGLSSVLANPSAVPAPPYRMEYPAQAVLRAGAACEAWMRTLSSGERMAADNPKMLAGILTDLRHFCEDRGLDFAALLEKATEQHKKGIERRAIEIPRWQEEFPDATEMPDLPAGFDDLSMELSWPAPRSSVSP